MKSQKNFWENYLETNKDLLESCKILQNIQINVLAAYEVLKAKNRIRNIPTTEYSLAELIDEFYKNINISQERDIEYQSLIKKLEDYENENFTFKTIPNSV